MADGAFALGWRVHSSWATLVAVSGSVAEPVLLRRERVELVDDASAQEPYHAAVSLPIDDVRDFVGSVQEKASAAAETTIDELASSLGTVAAVGVVGGDRRLPDLSRILAKHALLHAAERDLFERAVIEGARRAGVPVVTLPATGKLFDQASLAVGVELAPILNALGASVGSPWRRDHKEAAAVALVALGPQQDWVSD